MFSVNVTMDTSRFDRMMSDIPARMEAAKMRAMKDVGAIVRSHADMTFRHPPFRPSPWAPRKPSKRDDGHPLLQRSGAMKRTLRWDLDGSDAVVVGTKAYAIYHQTGTKNMPARPVFPIDRHGHLMPSVQRKIDLAIEKAFAEELKELRS